MKKPFFFFYFLVVAFYGGLAQTAAPWNGKKCAVVLTYDDAITQQLDNAIPVLDSLHLKATFYLTAYFAKDKLNEWKKIAARGYELGNHTLFHPCMGGARREWVKSDHDLHNYSVQRMIDEIRMTNVFLRALDGKTKRTFAFTCGDMKINDSTFMDGMRNDFVAARAVRNEMQPIGRIDLYNVACYVVNGNTAAEMQEWVIKARQKNSLLVILFHGVGGGNSLNVDTREHNQFLHYLKKNENFLWIDTMLDVAEYIKKYQAAKLK